MSYIHGETAIIRAGAGNYDSVLSLGNDLFSGGSFGSIELQWPYPFPAFHNVTAYFGQIGFNITIIML